MPKKSNARRADGRIAVQVYVGMVDGKRKYKTVYGKTQKEAEQKAAELRAQLRRGIEITAQQDTFSVWAKYWLALKSSEVSDDQYALIFSRVNYYMERIGDSKLTDLRVHHLQKLINDLALENPYTKKPTAKNTLRSYMQILSSVFDYAVDNRVMEFNPATKIKMPKAAPQKERHALSKEEQRWVCEFPHRAQPAAMLMMFSGLRRGEATALRWTDIDFENKTILVTRSYNFKQKAFKAPKNGKSRIVSVPDILIDYLNHMEKKSVFVLTGASGEMMTDTAWKRLFDSYMYCLNLKYGSFVDTPAKFSPHKIPMTIRAFTPHDLRHTFCTIMYDAGVDILTAQQQMGHSDVKTTLAIYTHLSNEKSQKDIQKMNDFINRGITVHSFKENA